MTRIVPRSLDLINVDVIISNQFSSPFLSRVYEDQKKPRPFRPRSSYSRWETVFLTPLETPYFRETPVRSRVPPHEVPRTVWTDITGQSTDTGGRGGTGYSVTLGPTVVLTSGTIRLVTRPRVYTNSLLTCSSTCLRSGLPTDLFRWKIVVGSFVPRRCYSCVRLSTLKGCKLL